MPLRWKRPRRQKFGEKVVAVFERASGYLRVDTHRISEYDRDVGIVRVFLILQAPRRGKRELEKEAQFSLEEKAEKETWKGDVRRKSKYLVFLEKDRSF